MVTPPTLDPALTVELGPRVVQAMNTQRDWELVLDRVWAWMEVWTTGVPLVTVVDTPT